MPSWYRLGSKSIPVAQKLGFEVVEVAEAVQRADVIMLAVLFFQGVYFPERARFKLVSQDLHTTASGGKGHTTITANLDVAGEDVTVRGEGDGPVEAFVHALREKWERSFDVVDYSEHAIGAGADAKAVAYVESSGEDGVLRWGIGIDSNITTASLLAVLAAFERQHG